MENKIILIDNSKNNPKDLDVITINIIDFDDEEYQIKSLVNPEESLMDVLKEAEFEMGHCGGMALCASCHCCVIHDNQLNSQSDDECAILDQLPNLDVNRSRLVCQIPLSMEIDGITLIIKH